MPDVTKLNGTKITTDNEEDIYVRADPEEKLIHVTVGHPDEYESTPLTPADADAVIDALGEAKKLVASGGDINL